MDQPSQGQLQRRGTVRNLDLAHDRLASVTLHQLRVFATVNSAHSFRRAADLLRLSEPTVSDQVKQLERSVGARLFERSAGRRRVELTEAGRILLQTCDDVFQALDRTARVLDAMHGLEGGTIAFGTDPHFGGYLVPRIYDEFRRAHPSITVHLEVDAGHRVADLLKQRRLDLAVLVGPITAAELASEPLAALDQVVVGQPGHRLAGAGPVPFQALADEQLVMPDQFAVSRQSFERLAVEAGIRLRVSLEVNNLDARKKAVMGGLGIAVLSTYSVADELAAGQLALLQVEGFPLRLPWLVVYPRGPLSPAARAFRDHLLSYRAQVEAMTAALRARFAPTARAAPAPPQCP